MARVLVVDDQKIPRVAVAGMLTQAGYEVAAEASGPEGIARAREWRPDVIVLDVQMPEMDGFAVVERLKEDPETAPIPVVFLTAEAPNDMLIVRGLELGAYDFLSKGCSRAELLARVGVMARIKRGYDDLAAVARISDTLIRTLDPTELSTLFVRETRAVFRADAALLVPAGGDHHSRAGDGIDPLGPSFDRVAAALLDYLREHDAEAAIVPVDEVSEVAGALGGTPPVESAIAARVSHSDHTQTLVAVLSGRTEGYRREGDAPLLHLFTRQAVIALDNALLHARTREQARKMEEQADTLERVMTQRSRFFASMSHELRTPINAVMGYSHLLQDGIYGDLESKQEEVVGKVARSAQHLLELVNDVLDISKLEAGKMEVAPETVDLPELLADTLASVQLQAEEKGIELRTEAPEHLVVNTDPARTRQILLNLLSNAVKFTDRGAVTIRIERGARADDVPGVEIRVADTGPGIPPEDRERVFHEFEQSESASSRGGTGLGLPISRRLTELLGGSLSLQSEVGVGSTFVLWLPLQGSAPASGRPGGG